MGRKPNKNIKVEKVMEEAELKTIVGKSERIEKVKEFFNKALYSFYDEFWNQVPGPAKVLVYVFISEVLTQLSSDILRTEGDYYVQRFTFLISNLLLYTAQSIGKQRVERQDIAKESAFTNIG